MQTGFFVLLGSMTLTAILFFISVCYTISGNIKYVKFMALGLLNMAISCAILLYCGDNSMSLYQTRNLSIANLVLIGLAALFYWSYELNKKQE